MARAGRPLTPGNEPGSDGNKPLRIRLTPEQRAEVQARGGSTWAREVLLREIGKTVNYADLSTSELVEAVIDIAEGRAPEYNLPLLEELRRRGGSA